MSPYLITQVVIAGVAFIGLITGIGTWLYRRGQAEAKIVSALDASTTATSANTAATASLAEAFHGFKESVEGDLKVHGAILELHDARLSRIEAEKRVGDPALRNAGSG